jgi:hypothetical protein
MKLGPMDRKSKDQRFTSVVVGVFQVQHVLEEDKSTLVGKVKGEDGKRCCVHGILVRAFVGPKN